MKRHLSRPRTFDLYERVADGPRGYVAPAECEDCGTRDDEHARWCQHFRGPGAGAHHVGSVNKVLPGDAAALSDEPDADEPSRARSTRTSRSAPVRRDPAQAGRAPPMSLVALCALLVVIAARGEELLCLSDRIRDALGITAVLVLVQCIVLGAERPCPHEQHGAVVAVAAEGGAP